MGYNGLSSSSCDSMFAQQHLFLELPPLLLKSNLPVPNSVVSRGLSRNATDAYEVKVRVTLATNVHGTNMVCQQLFPILRDGARVVFMTSLMAIAGLSKLKTLNTDRYMSYIQEPPLPLNDVLQSMREYEWAVAAGGFAEKGWPDDSAYTMSVVACTLMARAMNEEFSKCPERDIVVNAADPGHVSTNMSSYGGPLTTDQGADTPFYLATLPPKTSIKGQQVANREPVQWK